jgi:predicted enzyme involved in methoxymalonyl-ACP biosynthesis
MRFYIYRNTTLENVFGNKEFTYSDYYDVSAPVHHPDALLWFYMVSVEKSRSLLLTEIDAFSENIRFVLNQTSVSTPFYAITLYNFNKMEFEMTDFSIQEKINSFNAGLFSLMSDYPNLRVLDIDDFTRNYRSQELIDWKYYFSSGIVLNPRLSAGFKDWFWTKLDKMSVARKKCLILDLDNTLWYGVLGEENVSINGG